MLRLLLLLIASAGAHPGGHAVERASAADLAEAPCDLDLRLQRARAWRKDGALDHALTELTEARRCHPRESAIDLELGLLLASGRDPSAALDGLTRYLEAQGPHVGALLARSRVRQTVGDLPGAVDDLSAAVQHMPDPRPEHYLRLARGLAALQRHDEALAVARRGVADVGRVGSLLRILAVLESTSERS